MSIHKIAIHAVWGTKNRFPFFDDESMLTVCKHIFSYASKNNIYIDTINGHKDHMHCLFYLNPSTTLANTIKLLKGESSKWINENCMMQLKFGWADDYYSESIGTKDLEKVRAYITNQKQHHEHTSFNDEFLGFVNSIKTTK